MRGLATYCPQSGQANTFRGMSWMQPGRDGICLFVIRHASTFPMPQKNIGTIQDAKKNVNQQCGFSWIVGMSKLIRLP